MPSFHKTGKHARAASRRHTGEAYPGPHMGGRQHAARCTAPRNALHRPTQRATSGIAPQCIFPSGTAAHTTRGLPASILPHLKSGRNLPPCSPHACITPHHTEGRPTKNRAAGVVICHKSCKFAVQRVKEVPDVHFHEPIFATNDNRRTIEIQQGVCGKEEL